jgi:V8-like Glu-specific endopeptidase
MTRSETCQSEDLFMRVRISIVLAALAVTMLAPGAVGASGGNAASAAKAEHDRIVAYWTPARMAAAKSKDFAKDAKTGKITPYAKPGGGGVVGASWTGNGAIEQRSGKLFFSTSGGNWQCSASVVNDGSTTNGYSTILTAGHCTYDGSEGWSFNVAYIPDYDDAPTSACANTVHGCWTSTRLAINSDFYPSGFGPDAALRVDYGFMRMGLGGKSGTAELDAVTGGYGLRTSGVTTSDTQWAFGYPAAGKYHGNDLTYCKGTTINDPNGVGTWGMACNMTGGSSGGPWLTGTTNPADGSGALSSVNSYGYSGLTYMFGPRFNSETSTVLGDAVDGSATSGASVVH